MHNFDIELGVIFGIYSGLRLSFRVRNATMLNVHHTGLCSHSKMQNVANSLIVMKTMQLCWTFITLDCVHTLTFIIRDFVNTMGCKTLLTV